MNAHRRLTVALAATALTLTSALAAGSPASASDGRVTAPVTVPDTAPQG